MKYWPRLEQRIEDTDFTREVSVNCILASAKLFFVVVVEKLLIKLKDVSNSRKIRNGIK